MTALIEERRRNPGDDVVSALVRGDPELPPLDDEMVVGIVMMFISAGHNTTTSAIGNASCGSPATPSFRRACAPSPS